MRSLSVAALALAWLPLGVADAAPGPCERLFVPDGYRLTCTLEGGADPDVWIARVRPSEGTFSEFTELRVEPIAGPIDEPEFWLREQMVVDVSGFEMALEEFLDDPDSPLAEVPMGESLARWGDMMRALGQLPLQGCAEPVRLAGGADSSEPDRHEIACTFELGPLTHYMNVQLIQQGDEAYVMRLRAVNARRLRHLRAIANSF